MNWSTILYSLYTLLFLVIETKSRQVKIFGTEYRDVIPNEYVVTINTKKLKNDVETYRDIKENVAEELKDYLLQNVPNTDQLKIRRFIFPNNVVVLVNLEAQFLHLLQEHPMVSFIETSHKVSVYNTTFNVTGNLTLNDRTCLFQETGKWLWGLSRISSRNKVSRISEYMYGESDGKDVDIYILDTGIKIEHEDFGGRAVYGFTSPWIDEGPEDLHGHGSHIAATAGGTIHGVAKQANLISVKILNKDGVGFPSDIISGLEWVYQDIEKKQAIRGRRTKSVINMSLGGDRDKIQNNIEWTMLDIASEFGVTFVTAAGNSDDDSCYYSPARLSWSITVGSTDDADRKSDFSNHGPCVDILAPGSGILSAALGSNEDAIRLSGTSMACPHVSGVIARYLGKLCEMPSPAAVKAWLLNLATQDAIDIDDNTPNKLLYMPCFWDGSSIEAGAIIVQEKDFRYDIILFTLILGFGVLLLFSVGAMALSYSIYRSTRRYQQNDDFPVRKSKSRKYKVAQNDNLGFVGDDEEDTTRDTSNHIPNGECNNGIAVITQDLSYSDP